MVSALACTNCSVKSEEACRLHSGDDTNNKKQQQIRPGSVSIKTARVQTNATSKRKGGDYVNRFSRISHRL